MATESVPPEPINNEINFEVGSPANAGTVWVKWDVKGGGDRTHEPYINTNYALEGNPNIQGVEIKSTVPVILKIWGSYPPSGNPSITIDGPTNGKHKINPQRYGAYRVELRN